MPLFFLRFDSHATHARTLQPAALVFVSHGFVLVRVRVRVEEGKGALLAIYFLVHPKGTRILVD